MQSSKPSGHAVAIQSLDKRFGPVKALDGVTLDIEPGEFISLLGPSGSGKSTLLMAIAGFVACDGGRILVNGSDITDLPANRRSLGVVFQGYALFPHMTVSENIAYPLKLRGMPKSEIERRVKSVVDMVKLNGMEDRKPRQLSGGQQQRVALARAFVFEPGIVLLDEPLSALDKQLRGELQFELKSLHHRLGTTFINVTHDQEEAMGMSDRVAVLKDGKLMQVATPHAIYSDPNSRFVAGFVGHAAFIPGRASAVDGDNVEVDCGGHRFAGSANRSNIRPGDAVEVVLRPERLRLTDGAIGKLPGQIVGTAYHGPQSLYIVQTELGSINVTVPHAGTAAEWAVGKSVALDWQADAAIVLPQEG